MSQAKAILRNLHALSERRYVGDTNASDVLLDFHYAVKRAGLTVRQAEALRLVYVEDLTQRSAGERMGVDRITLKEHADTAVGAIDDVYEMIAWLNCEMTIETEAVG